LEQMSVHPKSPVVGGVALKDLVIPRKAIEVARMGPEVRREACRMEDRTGTFFNSTDSAFSDTVGLWAFRCTGAVANPPVTGNANEFASVVGIEVLYLRIGSRQLVKSVSDLACCLAVRSIALIPPGGAVFEDDAVRAAVDTKVEIATTVKGVRGNDITKLKSNRLAVMNIGLSCVSLVLVFGLLASITIVALWVVGHNVVDG